MSGWVCASSQRSETGGSQAATQRMGLAEDKGAVTVPWHCPCKLLEGFRNFSRLGFSHPPPPTPNPKSQGLA